MYKGVYTSIKSVCGETEGFKVRVGAPGISFKPLPVLSRNGCSYKGDTGGGTMVYVVCG